METTTTTTQGGAIQDVKNDLINALNDYEGGIYYACDLPFKLFEGDNANGSVFCNTYKTEQYIRDNWDIFGDFLEHYTNETGETLNPFTESEKMHVIFEIEAANIILSQCKLISDNWDNKVELTEEFILELSKQIQEVNEYSIF